MPTTKQLNSVCVCVGGGVQTVSGSLNPDAERQPAPPSHLPQQQVRPTGVGTLYLR